RMTGRVLIVDPVVTTRIVLKVKMAAAYFRVAHASSLEEAMAEVAAATPDVVLCEYDLPDGTAEDLQNALRAQSIPVIAILPEEEEGKRADVLAAKLGDVVSRPYDDRTLLARIRNLLRARTTQDELRLRADTSAALGFSEASQAFAPAMRVGLVAETPSEGRSWKAALAKVMPHATEVLSPADILSGAEAERRFDALVVGLSNGNAQQRLHFVSSLRARRASRHTAILAVSPPDSSDIAITALDTGAGDVMARGFEPREAAQRVDRLLERSRVDEALRKSVEAGLEAAVTDPLTGLFNRRYAIPYLDRIARAAKRSHRSFALMLLDLDHFKRINDTHGHPVGDAVLVEFAKRLRGNLRSVDLVARLGGEEFLVAMPDSSLQQASVAAARLCALTREAPFATHLVPSGVALSVSVGLALGGDGVNAEGMMLTCEVSALLENADHALYDAKAAGRDMVRVCQTAA
ncbi:MAG: diguanylate cyclase, partial [Pseudomonadota bacterium]